MVLHEDGDAVAAFETGGAEELLPFDGPGRPNVLQTLPGGGNFLMLSALGHEVMASSGMNAYSSLL